MAVVLPSEHVKDYLVTKGYTFGGTDNWALYIGKQPENPDRVITIYDSGGLAPDPKWTLLYPSVQLRIRGDQQGYKDTALEARKLRDYLIGVPSYTASNTDRIVSITGIGDIAHTGWDDKNRPDFVFNLRMIIEEDATPETNREELPIT